jgi:hypothetical protein
MFDILTTRELTVLQSMFYEGTQKVYEIADGNRANASRFGFYRSAHREVGYLFLEVGTELLKRLDKEKGRGRLAELGSSANAA